MGKSKRLQRKLNRMEPNTAEVADGKQEVNEFIEDNGTRGQKRRAKRLSDKVFKDGASPFKMKYSRK